MSDQKWCPLMNAPCKYDECQWWWVGFGCAVLAVAMRETP